jgi:hypothetical protein
LADQVVAMEYFVFNIRTPYLEGDLSRMEKQHQL